MGSSSSVCNSSDMRIGVSSDACTLSCGLSVPWMDAGVVDSTSWMKEDLRL